MKIRHVSLYRYDLPLQKSLYLASQLQESRSGCIIRLQDELNNTGFGEIAPLPGLHQEDLNQVLSELDNIKPLLFNPNFIDSTNVLKSLRELKFFESITLPSVRFGIEMAFLNMLAAKMILLPALLFSPSCHQRVTINGLLISNGNELVSEVQALLAKGYQSFKLKVGNKSLESDIENVNAVLKLLSDRQQLRLDANRSWKLGDALTFSKAITTNRIEYIEEPLIDPALLGQFHQQSGMRIALDESLAETVPAACKINEGIKALVLKPDVLGGLQKTFDYIKLAQEHNIAPIISSSFNSGVGLSFLVQLSAGMLEEGTAVGLDTYRWLKEDLLEEPIIVNQGTVDPDAVNALSRHIRFDLLTPLS